MLADFLLALKAERGLVVVDRTKVPLTRLTLAGVQMTPHYGGHDSYIIGHTP